MRRFWRRLVLLATVATGSALAGPAGAQLFGDRPWFDRPRHSPHYSAPFFGKRGSTWPSFPSWRGPYCSSRPPILRPRHRAKRRRHRPVSYLSSETRSPIGSPMGLRRRLPIRAEK
jgi:hypothetical protein